MNASEVRPQRVRRWCAQRLLWLLPVGGAASGSACVTGRPPPPAPAPSAPLPPPLPDGVVYDPVAVRCAPSLLPDPFLAAHRPELTQRGPVFEQIRGVVMNTLGVLLASGGWAGDGLALKPSHGSARDGTGEECQWLYAVSRGAPRGGPPPGSLALAGMVDFDYVPAHAGNPPQVVVRLVTALLHAGQALRLRLVTAATAYTEPGSAFTERNAEELTAELIRQVAERLTAPPGPGEAPGGT